jgi:hypothetical protein
VKVCEELLMLLSASQIETERGFFHLVEKVMRLLRCCISSLRIEAVLDDILRGLERPIWIFEGEP